MSLYTIHEDPRVDSYIKERLEMVVGMLVEKVPSIRSIILAGSYGKGEASVLVNKLEIKPLRDFDLVLVFIKERVPWQEIRKTCAELQERFCPIEDDSYYLMEDFALDIKPTSLRKINLFPDISTYDLKFCKLLYGEDIRNRIKWKLSDIPLRTAARALFSKAIALIGSFHMEYLSEGVPILKRMNFLRETSRAYIEICTALSLLAGRYDTSCIRRLETLQEVYEKEFSELNATVPNLLLKIERSTKYKLDPVNNNLDVNPIDYWFETRDDLGEVIKLYLKRYLSVRFSDWMTFAVSVEKEFTKQYYVPLIEQYLRSKRIVTNSIIIRVLNIAVNIQRNIKYSKRVFEKLGFCMPIFNGISSPSIKLFFSCPLLMFAINRQGEINEEYVQMVLKKLSFIKPTHGNSKNSWEEARYKFLSVVRFDSLI